MTLMSKLFKIVFKEISREDLTLFILHEISKLFKKQQFSSLMPEIFLSMVENTPKDNKSIYHIFSTITSIINQQWHDLQFQGLTEENISIILKALSICLQKMDQSKNNQQLEPKIYQQFIQVWIVIVSYLTSTKKDESTFRDVLIQIASQTPYIVFMNDFSLMLRMGSNKDVLEKFIQSVF